MSNLPDGMLPVKFPDRLKTLETGPLSSAASHVINAIEARLKLDDFKCCICGGKATNAEWKAGGYEYGDSSLRFPACVPENFFSVCDKHESKSEEEELT